MGAGDGIQRMRWL